jgi:hypothetical protein
MATITYAFDKYKIEQTTNGAYFMFKLQSFINELDVSEHSLILSALHEKFIIIAMLTEKETNKVASFAIMHKIDFDPFKNHTRPSCLDFIYTRHKFRKKRLCSKTYRMFGKM